MPGRSLSAVEKKLQKWWDAAIDTDYPLLEGLSVKSTVGGLRGIQEIDIKFPYPVMVIAGGNGAGKTTILGLTALGFHGADEHYPRGAKRIPKKGERFSYYTFQDFFFRGPSDPDITGLEISWRFRGLPELQISKQTDKWMRYERRPPRPVHYFGISRAVPAIEQSVLRSHFGGGGRTRNKGIQLSVRAVKWVGKILQRKYTTAEKLSSQRYGLMQCQATGGAAYSSFNMGAGEDLLFDLIGSIDSAPSGSLILVEEIEVGIHAAALKRLAEVLQEIALEKKLQIIVSSHSEQFVDALPRQARILLRREGPVHHVFPGVSTGFIFSDLVGVATPELKIYCEDEFARRLIECGLNPEIRSRVNVQAVGDKNTVADMAAYHIMSRSSVPCIVVWDGDVSDAEASAVCKKACERLKVNVFTHFRLPGGDVPEKTVVNAILATPAAITLFAVIAGVTEGQARSALDAALGESDHHSMPFAIRERLGLDQMVVVSALAQAATRTNAIDLGFISEAITKLL
jgi:ABC-type branched-subunit amino acid transport system ATPase component